MNSPTDNVSECKPTSLQAPASRPLNALGYVGIPLAIAVLLVSMPERVDFALADLFYRPEQGFIGRHNVFLEDWLHDRAKQLTIIIGILALAGFLLSLLPTRLRQVRRQLGYLALAMGLSTSVVPPLKAMTGMHCPWSLTQYGGVETFSPLFGPRAAPVEKPGRCWPGGHAGAGFSLFALYFFWRDRYPRLSRAALVFALCLGTLFSLVRMAQGAHFLSHNLWTAVINWLICYSLYLIVLYRPQPANTQLVQLESPFRASPNPSSKSGEGGQRTMD
ncbi:phosphatase PAP2 family protein [Azomonas macrocytogenes]|uniref:Membrane-associated PAP2 superfamily phosphatase n=1 Tax=Azomonas macrocytogenes TaxID=69962 RepID=A0A839T891_AZOMA|nr:phosphatase PAP2 family protein [Azomonas macrocytogenes]MBB3105308.1 membrane-associated PAP2 superfamily phosphatase [Azomonas macrocytogenes]